MSTADPACLQTPPDILIVGAGAAGCVLAKSGFPHVIAIMAAEHLAAQLPL